MAALSKEEDGHLKAKLVELLGNFLLDCIEMSAIDLATVIGHGNFWQTNTMFKYNQNGKPTSVVLLDFQSVRHSPPILDIVIYFYRRIKKTLIKTH